MPGFLVNIDVPDLEAGVAFYTSAFGWRVARRFKGGFVELDGTDVPVYLLPKPSGSHAAGSDVRNYERHWSPIHLDIVVPDMERAVAACTAAGAIQEGEVVDAPYGRLAMFADPFGHGFCLIVFNERGYGAVQTTAGAHSDDPATVVSGSAA